MKSRLVLFVIAMGLWLLLCWSVDWQHAVVGVGAALFVALFVGDMFAKRPHLFAHPARYAWFAVYLPIFLWECLKANLDGAYRVLHPALPIRPGIVKVRTTLKSDTGLTFLANSITLTPGTLTVDLDREGGYLYVHWINVKATDLETATRLLVSRYERILHKIFE